MGFQNFTKLIQTSYPLTQYDLMEKKLSLLWVKKQSKSLITEF
jgi:hypothetical protein